MNKIELKKWIKKHEGYRSKPYTCTAGKLTIGYGRNLQDNGLSLAECEFLLENDMQGTEKELLGQSWYINAPGNVKDALFNMCFNLGITRLLGFKRMIAAIIKEDYTLAAREALDSLWARQVPNRAKDVALMMRQG